VNISKIEWCDRTWNPVTGCLHNCPYCYAAKIAHRFGEKYVADVPKMPHIKQIGLCYELTEPCKASYPLFMKDSLAPIWGEPLIREFPW